MKKRTLKQVLSQIELLTREADALRFQEAQVVITRIKQAIAHYGLTEADLFGKGARSVDRSGEVAKTEGGRKVEGRASTAKAKPTSGVPKYADPVSGKTWTGQGRRPAWFKQATEAGKQANELLIRAS